MANCWCTYELKTQENFHFGYYNSKMQIHKTCIQEIAYIILSLTFSCIFLDVDADFVAKVDFTFKLIHKNLYFDLRKKKKKKKT